VSVDNQTVLIAERRTLVAIASQVAENARGLVSDAEYLLADGRWPRAYALAVLACEEFGKACGMMVLSMVPPALRSRARPKELLRDHQVKMLGALVMRVLAFDRPGVATRVAAMPDLASVLSDLQVQAADANEAKKSGLYADIDAEGRVRMPSEVTEGEARDALTRAQEVASSAEPLSNPVYLARLADPPRELVQLMTPLLIQALDSVPSDAGPEEMATAAIEFVRQAQSTLEAPDNDP
jgi:AbiV family abortive infection protein